MAVTCVCVCLRRLCLRQHGGIVHVGFGCLGCVGSGGVRGMSSGWDTTFTGLYPAAGPEGPSWCGSGACACVGCGGACVSKPPSTKFVLPDAAARPSASRPIGKEKRDATQQAATEPRTAPMSEPASAGTPLRLTRDKDGRSYWTFDASLTTHNRFDLFAAVATLPTGIDVKSAIDQIKAQALLQAEARLDPRAIITALLSKERHAAIAAAFNVRPSIGKGMGGFGAKSFRRGELILAEAPLVHWRIDAGVEVTRESLQAKVDELSPPDREAFYALCQNAQYGAEKHAYGIWLSNAFPTDATNAGTLGTPGAVAMRRSSAIYVGYCRLNHSCAPNVHGAWNAMRGRQTMFALRDISEGEELVVSYLGNMGEEQPKGEALAESDARCARLGELYDEIRDAVSMSAFQNEVEAVLKTSRGGSMQRVHALREQRRAAGVALLEERLELLKREASPGCASRAWDTLEALHRFCLEMGDDAAAERYAARAAESALIALGEQSAEYERYSRASGSASGAARGFRD